jgi:hypothetical protein
MIPDWFEELSRKAEYTSFPSQKKPYSSFKNYGQSASGGYMGNRYGYNTGVDFRKGENFRGFEDPGVQPKTFFNSTLNTNNQGNSGYNSQSNYNNSGGGFSNLSNPVHKSYSSNTGFGNANYNKPYGGANNTRSYFGEDRFAKP